LNYKMAEKDSTLDIDRLVVSSALVKAYVINMGKSILFVAALAGIYFTALYFLGFNPVLDALEKIGVSAAWAIRGVIAIIAAYFIIIIFSVSSLASFELVFEGDNLTYSYGSFFKTTKTTSITNIIRVNYKLYSPMKIGDLVLELTGTDDKTLVVQYISRAKENCEIINKLISFKRSQELDSIRDGVAA
jgi:predicted PurR-regulated permease PerM